MTDVSCLSKGIPFEQNAGPRSGSTIHAPAFQIKLTTEETKLAIKNALRYIPTIHHKDIIQEFQQELQLYGHIYMYRYRPQFALKAYPLKEFPTKITAAAAIMHMICNNLNPDVAQFPEELVTYGGNGQVFSNWAQFWLTMKYLSEMTEEQTLVLYSGHPMGLFPSCIEAPRAVVTNGMLVPNYSKPEDYNKLFALGVTQYGQMTAGSYCYIGPQGIVHGTTLTVLNAGRRMGYPELQGKVFLSSGLGGMSGAQAKAAVICGCIGVIAEVSEEALDKRYKQGWLKEKCDNLDDLIEKIKKYRDDKQVTSIGYLGNVVNIWEKLVEEHIRTGDILIDLASDQTSCHNPFAGGYYPVGLSYEEARQLMVSDPAEFKLKVGQSLRRQVEAINYMTSQQSKKVYFFDYGNAFLLQASKAGADVMDANRPGFFKYPSYVQDIMGDIFSMGFGPFRWVCTSGEATDLHKTDSIAQNVFEQLMKDNISDNVRQQYEDNMKWIKEAASHELVVGSQARILYSNQVGRSLLAKRFNEAVADESLKAPVVISRDHHDVSGTDSPFRETSNIYDGSSFCADMAVQNCIGDSFRGATWVSLHNGGGTGWGEAINGGFGLVLDGSREADNRSQQMLAWDVSNGVARRSWAGHPLALQTIEQTEQDSSGNLIVTHPHQVTEELLASLKL